MRLKAGGLWVHAPIAPTRTQAEHWHRRHLCLLCGARHCAAFLQGLTLIFAPAGECVRMVRELEQETGEKVKHIVLPTFGCEP